MPARETIDEVKPLFAELAAVIDKVGSPAGRGAREHVAGELVREGVAEDLARRRSVGHAFDDYVGGRSEAYERLNRLISFLAAQGETSRAALTVALRQSTGSSRRPASAHRPSGQLKWPAHLPPWQVHGGPHSLPQDPQ